MNKDLHLVPAQITIKILNQLMKPNQSLRLALNNARKDYQPRNINLWGQIHAWVMEILKHKITIDQIQHTILSRELKGQIKPFIDLATFWQFYGRRKSSKIEHEIKKLLKNENIRQPNWLEDFLKKISSYTLKEFSKNIISARDRWAFDHSLPKLMYEKLKTIYTLKEIESLGVYVNKTPLKYFWINSIREKNPHNLLTRLSKTIQFEAIQSVKGCYRILKKPSQPIQFTGDFNQGRIILQDVAAATICTFLPLKPYQKVLDVCAAPGNKTIQLLAREPQLDLWAGDKGRSRFNLLEKRVKFLLSNVDSAPIHLKEWDACNLPFENKSVDAVMIDAPCTGSGTLNTQPDNRLKLSQDFISSHVELQKSILNEAGRVVKKGGHVLYATCSLLPEENELVIQNFLKQSQGNEWNIKQINHSLAQESSILKGALRYFPPENQSEGFFVCLLNNQ
ncbi:MAG: RsmB/NOP family class I SAM-dependent RNA methyltransferase [Candidatus Hodarchaeales archaeon]